MYDLCRILVENNASVEHSVRIEDDGKVEYDPLFVAVGNGWARYN